MTHPSPDTAEMLRALGLMHAPTEIVELRAIRGRQIVAGYYDAEHWPQLAESAARLNQDGFGVYHIANAIDPALHGRYHNRLADRDVATCTDRDVQRRRWLLLDFDPVRPKDTAATDEQLAQAEALATTVENYLMEWGWQQPLRAMSGNGVHLHYRIDLPNDAPSTNLVERVLKALALMFNTAGTKVDVSVFNAARVWKLPGTVSNKGDHTPERPHRLAHITFEPDPTRWRDVLGAGELEQVAGYTERELQQATGTTAPASHSASHTAGHTAAPSEYRSPSASSGSSAEILQRVLDGLSARGIEIRERDSGSTRQLVLSRCPWNAEHDRGEASIFVQPSGALGFRCLHNSCADNKWRQLRELVLGQTRPGGRNPITAGPSHAQATGNGSGLSTRKAAAFDLLARQVGTVAQVVLAAWPADAPRPPVIQELARHIDIAEAICQEVERP